MFNYFHILWIQFLKFLILTLLHTPLYYTQIVYFFFLRNSLGFSSQLSIVYDYNFVFILFLTLSIICIIYTPLHLNKALYLYVFLFYMLLSMVIFSLNSFIGFLIVVELSTVTFIVTLIYTFSNFFTAVVVSFNLPVIFSCLLFGFFSVFLLNQSLSYMSFFKFFNLDCWNDLTGVYLYLYLEAYVAMLFICVIFLGVTIILIDLIRCFFLLKVPCVTSINSFLLNFFVNFKKRFFQKNKNWRVVYSNGVSRFFK